MENSTVLDDFALENEPVIYGGFWERFAAAIIDGIILSIVGYILSFLGIGLSLSDQIAMQRNPELATEMMSTMFAGIGVSMGLSWLYHALQESSESQATIGKKVLGLKVTDLQGERISFLRATARHFSKLISSAVLLIGYIMQPFTKKKQALHDIIAGALIVKSKK